MLNLLRNGEVIGQVAPRTVFQHGDEWTSPAYAGWANGEYELVEAPPAPEPEPLTPEELRAQMPSLTRRQFWLGAKSLGLSKANVMAATNDPVILIEIEESGEFHRTYESILMLSDILGITPEQLDDVWMWWASA